MKYNVDSKFEDSCILTKRNHLLEKKETPDSKPVAFADTCATLMRKSYNVVCFDSCRVYSVALGPGHRTIQLNLGT